MKLSLILIWVVFSFMGFPFFGHAAQSGDVIVNEIAWMGTEANNADEWIELHNTTDQNINLTDWGIYEKGGSVLIITLKSSITPHGYFLIERTDDNTIKDIPADTAGSFGKSSGLSNEGEHLVLKDNTGKIIQELNFSSGWPVDKEVLNYASMEWGLRGWEANNGSLRNGSDAAGNSIKGTPRSVNSAGAVQAAVSFVVTPAATPTQTPTSTPSASASPSSQSAFTPSATPLPTVTQTATPAPTKTATSSPQVSVAADSVVSASPSPRESHTATSLPPRTLATLATKTKSSSLVTSITESPSVSPSPSSSVSHESEAQLAVVSEGGMKPIFLSIGGLLIVLMGTLGVLWKYVIK